MNNKIQYLTEAAFMCAIIAVFMLVSYLFGGILESFCFFILPVPLAIYSHRYGIKKSFIPLIAMVTISLIINFMSGIFYVLPASILGIIYGGILVNKKYNVRLIACIITSFIVSLCTMVIFARMFNYDILEEIKIIVDTFIKIFNLSVDENMYSLLLYNSVPSFVFIMAILEGFLINYFASFIMYRIKEIRTFELDIYGFKLPKIVVIVYLILLTIFIATFNIYPNSSGFVFYLLTLNSNLFVGLSFLLILQGALFLEILLLQKFQQKAIILMIIFFVLVIIVPFIIIILLLLGIIYSFTK